MRDLLARLRRRLRRLFAEPDCPDCKDGHLCDDHRAFWSIR